MHDPNDVCPDPPTEPPVDWYEPDEYRPPRSLEPDAAVTILDLVDAERRYERRMRRRP